MKLTVSYFFDYDNRDWKYGGSWENRSLFAFDLYERIKKEINDSNFLIGSKISAWEGFPGGFGTDGPESPIICRFIFTKETKRRYGKRYKMVFHLR